MTNRYPLIVDPSDGNKIKELPSGDNLQLTGSAIIGVTDGTASGTIAGGVLSAASIKKGGTEIATIAITGAWTDVVGRPTQLSQFTNNLNFLVPGNNISVLTNDAGYAVGPVSFNTLSNKPTTIAGYGITDVASSSQGILAASAIQPGDNISRLFNNQGYLTAADIQNGLVTIDVNNTGDLVGSVFADDSTVMIDSILAAVNLDGTIRGHVKPYADQHNLWDLGTSAIRFKDAYFQGNVTVGGAITGALSFSSLVGTPTTLAGYGITDAIAAGGTVTPVSVHTLTNKTINTASNTITIVEADISDLGSYLTSTGVLSSHTDVHTATPTNGQVLAWDQSNTRWAPATNAAGGDSIGNFTLSSSVIDTDDSSGIVITPAVTISSDLLVQNDLRVTNTVYADSFESTNSGVPEIRSSSRIELIAEDAVVITKSPIRLAAFTTTTRNALTPTNGDTIYNSTTNKFQGYAGGAWVDLH
jgi:hypothetical protein